MFWVYMLKCADNSYYTGHTDDLDYRLSQPHHKAYLTCYTATRLPVQLVFSSEFSTRDEAFNAERQIKGWSRKRQGAFIRKDWIAISFYAKRHKAFQ